jgi:hypothetical protein
MAQAHKSRRQNPGADPRRVEIKQAQGLAPLFSDARFLASVSTLMLDMLPAGDVRKKQNPVPKSNRPFRWLVESKGIGGEPR